MTARPEHLVVVAGTGTEVGKTWVSARLATELRPHMTIQARKPAQSFDASDPIEGTDAAQLGAATGEDPTTVCPPSRWYRVAMAPPMAADALDREPIHLRSLLDELDASWSSPAPRIGLVELAGGLWSPIAHDGDCLTLTRRLRPAMSILVADAGLGTINAIRPALAALREIAPVVTLLNRYDHASDLHRRNLAWLEANEDGPFVIDVGELSAVVAHRPVPSARHDRAPRPGEHHDR